MLSPQNYSLASRDQRSQQHDNRDWIIACALVLLTVALRIPNRGALYFVDGPRIVYAIVTHTFVVQPPGYWLYAHLGGLFHNATEGLAFWNITFSSLGAGMFYLLCRLRQPGRLVCSLAALSFATVYFVWFSGEIHSSYASQILFPPLALYCFLRFRSQGSTWWAAAWALSAALGWAVRPSDGVFLLPLWCFLLFRYVRNRKVWAIYFGINASVFLAWYIPTQHALKASFQPTTSSTLLVSMQTVSPLLTGINARSLANMARVAVPLLIALWALIPAMLAKRDPEDTRLAAIWTLPGLLFFALCYMADPTYLIYLTGAFFWLVITSYSTRRSSVCLILCVAFNVSMFCCAQPVHSNRLASRLLNFYAVKYCRYGLRHQWSSTLGDGARIP